MSEKRFVLFGLDNETIKDDVTKECYWVNEYVQRKKLVDLLNEQQDQINELKAKLREKEEDEKLYANEIVELRKTNEEWLQCKNLGGDY